MPKAIIRRTSKATRSNVNALCGRALRFLDEQHLEPTPVHYAFAYAALGPDASALSRAVDAITLSGNLITSDQAADLTARYIEADPDKDGNANGAVRQQTMRLASLAADAVAASGDFSRDLSAELDGFPKDGTRIVARIEAMVARSERAEKELSAAANELEDLRQELDAARSDAYCDALTDIANRRGAERRIAELNDTIVIALCDVDRFKSVNDEFGHAVGDRLLKLVAETLVDVCAPHLVSRWGGEEFLILFERTSLQTAAAVLDEARRKMEERRIRIRQTDRSLPPVTFSAGVAVCPADAFSDALHAADLRLYAAKAAGRNRIVATG